MRFLRDRRKLAGLSFLSLAALGVLAFTHPAARWRAELVGKKLSGELVGMSWSDVAATLVGAKRYRISSLLETGNVHRITENTHTSPEDIEAGARLFRERCARCHGVDGSGLGDAPDLRAGELRHGASDHALFRTISEGVAGTNMPGFDLPERRAWQLVSYVRSLSGVEVEESEPEAGPAPGVDAGRLLAAESEPSSWLTYSGGYASRRYSRLDRIDTANVAELELKWAYQLETAEPRVETTPLVVDGTMYLTTPTSGAIALEAATGREVWRYEPALPDELPLCCGRVNRGLAVLGDRLYLGMLDARLVALDARTGEPDWEIAVGDPGEGYTITAAPLALKDRVITGVAGGEYGIRGFIDAYDAETGERLWRFHTVPEPGAPGHDTWAGDSWRTGGAATWMTGSYDADLDLIYWGVGNPAPPFNGEGREGDNLYSNSVVALDAETGELEWHFQFTPHDVHDWDANQIPVLVDGEHEGRERKLMLWANRNGFFYVLDRTTGAFLHASAYAEQNWAERIDSTGRPVRRPGTSPSPEGTLVLPGLQATNWWSPSYSPRTGLFYVPTREMPHVFFSGPAEHEPGEEFMGSGMQSPQGDRGDSWLRALDPATGEIVWEYRMPERMSTAWFMAGVLSTAGDVLFAGAGDAMVALDARSGAPLETFILGNDVIAAPITYEVEGDQRVTIAAGRAIFTFGLPDEPQAIRD